MIFSMTTRTASGHPLSPGVLLAKGVVLVFVLVVAGCGGGGSDQPAVGINSSPAVQETTSGQSNFFTVTRDDYGLITPNFLYSTDNLEFWSLQANVAAHVVDPDTRCVIRIDILKDQDGTMPPLSGRSFSFDGTRHEKFPGTFFVFNGRKSVYKKVEEGTISFSAGSSGHNVVTGEFDVVLTDYDSTLKPTPRYRLQGTFGFAMGTYGPTSPLSSHVYPPNGENTYLQRCAQCHSLSDYNEVPGKGPDLSQRGGELPVVYPGTIADHGGIYLDQKTMQELRIFLNAW